MGSLLSPDDLHQWIQGKPVIASHQHVLNGLQLSCFQYAPWSGTLPPLRDHLLIAYHRPTKITQQIGGHQRSELIPSGACSILTQATESKWQWESPIENTDIHISPDLISKIAAEVFDRDIQSAPLLNDLQLHDPILQDIVFSLEREAGNLGVGGKLYMEALTNQLCVQLLRNHSTVLFAPIRMNGGLSPVQAKRVTEYIESNLSGVLSLNELAELVKVSPYHFARQFKVRFGCPPHAYVISLRLNRARELLNKSKLMLKEIAGICGFSDQAHMTRLFRRQFNATPKEVRSNYAYQVSS